MAGEKMLRASAPGQPLVGDGSVWLEARPEGLTLTDGTLEMRGDFVRMLKRIQPGRLQSELLLKAAKVKTASQQTQDKEAPERLVVDATAGLGEDSFLLAAAGYRVFLYERDPVIAALLRDALERAAGKGYSDSSNASGNEYGRGQGAHGADGAQCALLAQVASRMTLFEEDSIVALRAFAAQGARPDVVLLDPMFPARQKSAAVKKKFQLLHHLEQPCVDEQELLDAAIAAAPRKIVIKRPPRGPNLTNRKPSYSLSGKAVRYDVIALAPNN